MSEPEPRPWPRSDRLRQGRNGLIYEARGPEEHGEGCECTRCKGFTPGPTGTGALTPLRHGARSMVEIQGRASEVAADLRVAMEREDLYRATFEPMIATTAVLLVRVERAARVIDAAEEGLDEGGPLAGYFPGKSAEATAAYEAMARLRDDLRKWAQAAQRGLESLGLTPRALAAISRDTGIGKATRANAALRALDEHLDTAYRREIGA